MRIVMMGAGVQGTLYGVRLARAGHDVTLIAKDRRADELELHGAVIENVVGGKRDWVTLPVRRELGSEIHADLCFVCVRREQLDEVLPQVLAVDGIARIVLMVNFARPLRALEDESNRRRIVLGFPGAAGGIEDGVDRYIDIGEQPTSVEASARDVAEILRGAGFRVCVIADMESWLARHAVFVTAMGGALCEAGIDAQRLAADDDAVRCFVLAVREGWAAMDRRGVAPAPLALRAIFQWIPLPFAARYWKRLLAAERGDHYFARHTRHALVEMAALAEDVQTQVPVDTLPHLRRLYAAIGRTALAKGLGT